MRFAPLNVPDGLTATRFEELLVSLSLSLIKKIFGIFWLYTFGRFFVKRKIDIISVFLQQVGGGATETDGGAIGKGATEEQKRSSNVNSLDWVCMGSF